MSRLQALAYLRMGWRDWLEQDAPSFGYVFKVLLACLLAMWLSLRLEVDQPRTAMLTVAIVMQSQHAGMVFAKSLYRLVGTTAGIFASLLLVALFAQERSLFLLCMTIWIGLCTAGSMVYRNHQSYAFVLAGYTLCIVGLPAAVSPEQAFDIATSRISEILIGLLCATVVSDLVFPKRLGSVMLGAVRRRYRDFTALLHSASNSPPSLPLEPMLLHFVGDIFSLESFRASSALESDESRAHRLRLGQINAEFMEVSTTFHAFEQLLRRQRKNGRREVRDELLILYRELGAASTLDGEAAHTEREASSVTARLSQFRSSLEPKLASAMKSLPPDLEPSERLDFETGGELLQRLVDELLAYTRTYASLSKKRGDASPSFSLGVHFDPLAVALAGARGALALAIMSSIWIFTEWGSGIEAITLCVVTSTLFATTPSPTKTIRQFFTGALIGTMLAYFCNFHVLPHAQGFLMLALAISPGIMLAAWLTSKPETAVTGAGMAIVFLMHAGFGSAYHANPDSFLNDAIADLLAILLSGVLYGLIDLSTSRWSRLRTVSALRKLVVEACREPLTLRRANLEIGARDLVQRSGSARRIGEPEDRLVIEWLLSVLEIGHAVIALRKEMKALDSSEPLNKALEAVAQYFEAPSGQTREAAMLAVHAAGSALDASSISPRSHLEIKTMIHFIHSALQDDHSIRAAAAATEAG